jgi:plasmid stabilization system protein ParE
MSYRIHTTAQAEADIDRIFTWLAARSPQGAARWYESRAELVVELVSGGIGVSSFSHDELVRPGWKFELTPFVS